MQEPIQETLTIRPARLDELAVCASFWMAMFEEIGLIHESDVAADWRERYYAYFTRRIQANEAQIFVAMDDAHIAGTAGAMVTDGYPSIIHGLRFGYIFGIRVDPKYRAQGLATALTRRTIAFLKEKQCRRISLHASPFGRRIYERLGFEPSNEMKLRK